MCGAVINVTVCMLLIPRLGAQGAAIAAAISYFIVFIVRAVNTQRYVRFDMHPMTLLLNSVLLVIQCVVMVLEVRYWMVIEGVCFVLIVALNAKPIIDGLLMLLRGMKRMLGGRGGAKK